MNDLTWTCHICNEERPDAKISVLSKDLGIKAADGGPIIGIIQGDCIEGVVAKQNIRYCNDKDSCIEGAKEFSFMKESDDD